MSNIVADVKNGQNKDDMLYRALERIIQLYTDKSHFVYELLQNAEDADATRIKFIQYPDRLEVFHDGKPFTTANLQGLCDIGKSDKVDDLNQIGEFGIGFKSVFGICDTVFLYSAPNHFREKVNADTESFAAKILGFTHPEDISEEEIPKEYTTRFVFPYAVGRPFSGFPTKESLIKTLSRKLENLGITTLLFMKKLKLIEYQIQLEEEPVEGKYSLDKKEINDHCLLVSAYGTMDGKKSDGNSEETVSYLKFSRPIQKYAQRTVDIAFPIRQDKDGSYQCIKAKSPYVSVYFPTETESKLDFIVQGPYRTTPNRSSIPAEDEDNIQLAKETAILLRESILELKESGKFNMSFVKILPISEDKFEYFNLFRPLYETVKTLFLSEAVIPSKSGKYIYAKSAKISRSEPLTKVFTDSLLTQLINDGRQHYWLPMCLTRTNREYMYVFEYMTKELNIPVVYPEGLHTYFASNPKFLTKQTDDWLVKLYEMFKNIPAAFSHVKYGLNLATADIIKTESGIFVAPFRKEGETYVPNVFLPSPNIHSTDIHFVNEKIYNRCHLFFDTTLRLTKPNGDDLFIKNIEKRYGRGFVFNEKQHIDDIKALLKYVKLYDYRNDASRIIREKLKLRCTDGEMRNAHSVRIFVPITSEKINIEAYYRNVDENVFFVDLPFYESYGIDEQKLTELGVCNSLLVGSDVTEGTYDTTNRGQSPTWWTTDDFRWKLSIDSLKEVLKYIWKNPREEDAALKSQTIMKVLVANEKRLRGWVNISGNTIPDLEKEPCEMIHILRGEDEGMRRWSGEWLFTESDELVSPRCIFKHDLNTSIYGEINPDSVIFELLGFKRTEADEVEDLKKKVSSETLEAYFERELMRRFGISTADLNARFAKTGSYVEVTEEIRPSFPSHNVRSWESLRKHAAEMLNYAVPVRYEERMQSVRVSSRSKEVRAYLQNMYRLEGNNLVFACQLCHSANFNFLATEVFLKPKKELEPINLCLCPNCSAVYRRFRGNSEIMKKVREAFLTKVDTDIETGDYVCISIDDDNELWFTQTHFAEIRELIRLEREMKKSSIGPAVQTNADDKSR